MASRRRPPVCETFCERHEGCGAGLVDLGPKLPKLSFVRLTYACEGASAESDELGVGRLEVGVR